MMLSADIGDQYYRSMAVRIRLFILIIQNERWMYLRMQSIWNCLVPVMAFQGNNVIRQLSILLLL